MAIFLDDRLRWELAPPPQPPAHSQPRFLLLSAIRQLICREAESRGWCRQAAGVWLVRGVAVARWGEELPDALLRLDDLVANQVSPSGGWRWLGWEACTGHGVHQRPVLLLVNPPEGFILTGSNKWSSSFSILAPFITLWLVCAFNRVSIRNVIRLIKSTKSGGRW